ncbi:hypothetical protein D3C86_1606050 [compost metagenome]
MPANGMILQSHLVGKCKATANLIIRTWCIRFQLFRRLFQQKIRRVRTVVNLQFRLTGVDSGLFCILKV